MRHPALLIAFICVTSTAALAEGNASPATRLSTSTAVSPRPVSDLKGTPVLQIKAPAASNSWKALLLIREEIPNERNALVRWRPLFDRLQPDTVETFQLLQNLVSPIEDVPALNDPTLKKWLSTIAPTVNEFVLRDGEAFQLPVVRGPETPFPDHAPLIQLATVRVALMKTAWLDGRSDEAVALAIENLRLARALLNAQEALISVIQAAGVWQISLDGVYWLGRQEALSPEAAAHLQNELLADERLASSALIRAFRGEFTFFTHLVIERLPKTKDANLLLAGIASLGMITPEPPKPDEPQLAMPESDPFDREATLQLSANDISGWISAFAKNRHPGGLTSRHTAPQLQAYAKEIEPLLRFATEDVAPTPERLAAANQTIASVKNSVGKLFLVITTSQWEPLSTHLFRREAERSALVGLLAQRRLTTETDTSFKAPPFPASTQPDPAAIASTAATNSTSASTEPAASTAPIVPTAPTLTVTTIASVAPVPPRFTTWEKLVAAKLLPSEPADPFTTDAALYLDIDPLQPRIWSVGENGIDDGGQGSGENVGRPLDLTWPIPLLTRPPTKAYGP